MVQLYVKQEQPFVERPDKELKAFEKIHLNPGESKVVTLKLSKDAFAHYDDKTHT